MNNRPCTCHPEDNPPVPCPHKYALDECRRAAEPVAWSFEARHIDTVWALAVTLKHPGAEGPYMRNVRPLYAAPQPTAEAVRDAMKFGEWYRECERLRAALAALLEVAEQVVDTRRCSVGILRAMNAARSALDLTKLGGRDE